MNLPTTRARREQSSGSVTQRESLPRAALLLGMALSLALCYRAGVLSPVYITWISLGGLALFGLLALARPDMALLFVPLTVPLFGIPLVLPNLRATTVSFQLHELVLLTIVAAVAARLAWRGIRAPDGAALRRLVSPEIARRYAPHALLLLTACVSVLNVVDRSQALRELRWLVIEPLLFYALLRFTAAERWALRGLVVAGAVAGLIGMLQVIGIDVVPLGFGFKSTGGFADSIVSNAGFRRATSVYQHPNNLGLALGRVWPLAAVLALAAWNERRRNVALLCGLAALLCLGGIGVSLSRGAWLGALAAAAVLLVPFVRRRLGQRALPVLIGGGVVLVLLGAVAVLARGSILGGSTSVRLLLWQESLQYIAAHPLGLGMGQFYFYHNPEFGRSLIDPSLLGTSEQFASHPHNLVLDTWLRLGPLGVLAFGWLLARFARHVRARLDAPLRAPQSSRAWLVALGAAAAMTAALVHGMVDVFYFVPDLAIMFWLLLALVEDEAL